MNEIKDSSKIVSDTKVDGVRSIIIKKNDEGQPSFLGDILNFLPAGLVNKTETGMGATTLELITPRNSIIVEPIKITASSKAFKHDALYVGSSTQYHPARVTSKIILDYLKDEQITYKKFVVVADSLYRLIKLIGEDKLTEFHLLIDEVDSFQLDSTYRKSMEECIEYYKKFNPSQRTLLSATTINFSDPILKSEPVTIFKYDVPGKRNINLKITDSINLVPVVVDYITDLVRRYPNDKIFVAYNSVKNCKIIANHIIQNEFVRIDEVCILCSSASKDKVGMLYKELDSEQLPCKVNFVTSAYFTGFDLLHKYHLVTISGTRSGAHTLSEKRIKQIAGRARIGLFSETIIHDVQGSENVDEEITVENVISDAQSELDTLVCIKKHFSKSTVLEKQYSIVSSAILNALEESGCRFVRKNSTGHYVLSYLNIDAYIEKHYSIRQLYKIPELLSNTLRIEGHSVNTDYILSDTRVVSEINDRLDIQDKVREIVDELRCVQTLGDLQNIAFIYRKSHTIQRRIIAHFEKFYTYIDKNQFLDKLSEFSVHRDSRAVNNFIMSATSCIIAPGSLFKSRLLKYFKVGDIYSPEELQRRWQLLFHECNQTKPIDSTVKAVRFTKAFFGCHKNRTTGFFKILNTNPHNLIILKTMPEAEDEINLLFTQNNL